MTGYLHWFILGFPWLQGLLRSCLGLGMSNLLLFGCTGLTLEEICHYFRCEYVMCIYNYIQLYIYNIHIYIYIHTGVAPPPSNSCGHCYWEGSIPSNVQYVYIYICTYKTVLFSVCLAFVVSIIHSVPQMLFGGVSSYCIGIAANMSMLIMVSICHEISYWLLSKWLLLPLLLLSWFLVHAAAWYYSFVYSLMLTFMSLQICLLYILVYTLKYVFSIHI